ncbi:MAG: hypothetical protein JNN15_15750 [Blastocatellia bacterium]|nr:hypothetical protein [Blastocatellia bacterium]
MARSSGAENLAITHLNKAKTFAKDIEKTGDKIGIDLVRFYSDLHSNRVHKLLKLRQKKDQLANVPAIDNFQENISQLEILKKSFESEGAKEDTESVAFLLAKFLVKSGSYKKAGAFIEPWLKVSERDQHRLGWIKFTFLKGQVAIYEAKHSVSAKFNTQAIEASKNLHPNTFQLYLLHPVIGKQAEGKNPENVFKVCLEVLDLSLKSMNKAPSLYSGFAATYAQFQGLGAKNLSLNNLAREYLLLSINLAEKNKLYGYEKESRCLLAVLEVSEKRIKEAFSQLRKAESTNSKDPFTKNIDQALIEAYRAKIYGLLGTATLSEQGYRKALAILEKSSVVNFYYPMQVRQGLGEALWLQKKNEEALVYLEKAKNDLAEAQTMFQVLDTIDSFRSLNFTDKTPEEIIHLINK